MKNILISILAVFSISAFAQTQSPNDRIDRFEVENKQGGKIVLELSTCKDYKTGKVFNGARNSYYYLKDGTMGTGCWIFKAQRVKVIWDDGTSYMYDPGDFTPIYK